MSQQELDEVDKIIEEIIVFGSMDYSRASMCLKEAEKHFPHDTYKREYIFHSLRIRTCKFYDTRMGTIKYLRGNILNGHREDNQ